MKTQSMRSGARTIVAGTDSRYLARKEIRTSYETIHAIVRKDKFNRGILYKFCRHKLKHRDALERKRV